jgi:hypothetical protein
VIDTILLRNCDSTLEAGHTAACFPDQRLTGFVCKEKIPMPSRFEVSSRREADIKIYEGVLLQTKEMTTSSSSFRHVIHTHTTWLSDRPFGELRRLMYGFNHAAFVSLACASNVKSSAMINGGSNNRKAKRYIDTALEA